MQSLKHALDVVCAWALLHPMFMGLIVWPALTGIGSWATRHMTDAAWQALHPRAAAVLKLVAAMGLDVPKIVRALQQYVTKAPVLLPGTRLETPQEAITAPELDK